MLNIQLLMNAKRKEKIAWKKKVNHSYQITGETLSQMFTVTV